MKEDHDFFAFSKFLDNSCTFLKDLFFQRFNGLFAPHWRSDARGVIVGLTQYTRREHICRATLEAVAFQVYEILLAMEKDSGHRLKALLVDGGMTKNDLLMQIQADFNGNFPFYRIAMGVKKL